MHKLISIENGISRHPAVRMCRPVSLDILAGEQLAIVGRNGAGKSRLVDLLTGRYPLSGGSVSYDFSPSAATRVSDAVRRIAFSDAYGPADQTYYLQQRWNQHDIDPETPTVGALLDEVACATSREHLYSLFGIDAMRERLIISLSSGELRKFHIARTLLAAPRLLILDNPFVGLDAAARGQLCDLLRSLVSETGLQVILELSRDSDIPDFITHVVVVEDNMTVLPKQSLSDYRQSRRDSAAGLTADERQRILGLPPKDLAADKFYAGGEILSFHDVSISYFGRTILDHVSWQVAEGERWALLGPNGSGKSTLLSLVSADNPQGYACDIRLFGHRRGTGESIWDVKRHIGYVSPELHRAYRRSMAAIDVVASGMHDSVGLYVRPTDEEREACRTWMDIFRIGSLADADFRLLSSGEQRMCLLARAFVKDPELLILDEPLHGLDTFNRALVRDIIEVFCARTHKTLIMVTHYPEELPECITPGCVKRLT